MKDFDYSSAPVDPEDLLDGGDFISDFTATLAEHKNRLTATRAETAAARTIRNKLSEETGAKVRLEAFNAHPYLGRASFPLGGIWYAFSLVLYFISFAGGDAAGIWLTALSLVVFLTGMFAVVSLFFGGKMFRWLLNKRVSYNVVSEQNPKLVRRGKERTIIIADNHDAKAGSFTQEGVFKKVVYIAAPVTSLLFVIFCIIKMAVGVDTSAKITALTVLPAIVGGIGIFLMLVQFSPFERHARQNNGIATSVAMAAYGYFVEYPELVPDDVRFVYVSLGGENSGRSGSEAFINSHPEFRKDTKVLAIGDINGDVFQVAECDPVKKIMFSTEMVSAVRSNAHSQGIEIETVRHASFKEKLKSLHGYISNNFSAAGISSATLLAAPRDNIVREELDRSDVEKLFSLTIGTLKELMKGEKTKTAPEAADDFTDFNEEASNNVNAGNKSIAGDVLKTRIADNATSENSPAEMETAVLNGVIADNKSVFKKNLFSSKNKKYKSEFKKVNIK